jgi:hypothetical protein
MTPHTVTKSGSAAEPGSKESIPTPPSSQPQPLSEAKEPTGSWQPEVLRMADGRMIELYTKADPEQGSLLVLPSHPLLVTSSKGHPQLNLSLILDRQPLPEEGNVSHLITSGLLTMDLCLKTSDEILKTLAEARSTTVKPLFIRKARYSLSWTIPEGQQMLFSAEGNGMDARAGIHARLKREQCMDVLAALDGAASSLNLEVKLSFRSEGAARLISISGSWPDIHAFFVEKSHEGEAFSRERLHSLIPLLQDQRLMQARQSDGSVLSLSDEDLVRIFMRQSAVIFRKETDWVSREPLFYLRPAPPATLQWQYSEMLQQDRMQHLQLSTTLEAIISDRLKTQHWDEHVHLLADQSDSPAQIAPVARKVRTWQKRSSRKHGSTISMAAVGKSVATISSVVKPQKSHAQLIAHKPLAFNTHLQDLQIQLNKSRYKSLPVVEDINAPYWRDKRNRNRYWYLPTFEIVAPDMHEDPAEAPFLFSYERTGTTNTGRIALQGRLRFTLRQQMSQATAKKLGDHGANARPVRFESIAVFLMVPFVDEKDGQLKHHPLSTELSRQGDKLLMEVPLINEWVRLTYGALARQDFQAEPLRIRINLSFASYVQVSPNQMAFNFGGKSWHTPVVYSALEREKISFDKNTYFDASNLSYVQPLGEIHFKKEVADQRGRNLQPLKTATAHLQLSGLQKKPQPGTLHVKPQLDLQTSLKDHLNKTRYAQLTQKNRQEIDMLMRCNELGRYYREKQNGTYHSIGCRDALSLGQITYRQYEEINELAHDRYRVFRSLSQPGNFLVVPARFCIGRKAASEAEEAYRPLIFLNALIDAQDAANNRVELRASLQPDMSIFEVKELEEKLKLHDPQPKILYPTDISAEAVNFNWALPQTILADSEAHVLNSSGPFISTFFSMDLPSWQIMRDVLADPGVNGSASFRLSDDTVFHTGLMLKLDRIQGPWDEGPLELERTEEHIRITNRIEQPLQVSDMVQYAGDAVVHRVPLEMVLEPGQGHTVESQEALLPVFSYSPGSRVDIREVRSFVEDIYGNLIFVNLLNFEKHQLRQLLIRAHLQGMSDMHKVQLSDEVRVAEIQLILPLTTYLEEATLLFEVNMIFHDREPINTDWLSWNLLTDGPVSITSQLLNL